MKSLPLINPHWITLHYKTAKPLTVHGVENRKQEKQLTVMREMTTKTGSVEAEVTLGGRQFQRLQPPEKHNCRQ